MDIASRCGYAARQGRIESTHADAISALSDTYKLEAIFAPLYT